MNEKKNNVLGILSLVFGIIGLLTSIILIGCLPSAAGLILGIISLAKGQAKGLPIAGVVCSTLGILVVIFLFIVSASPEFA